MTEKEVERDLGYLRGRLARDTCTEGDHEWARLLLHLYEERAAQGKQEEKPDPTVVSAGEVIPNEPDLYEVVCPAGVVTLRCRDVVRMHLNHLVPGPHGYLFVRQSDFSTHPIRIDENSPFVKLRKIENLESQSL